MSMRTNEAIDLLTPMNDEQRDELCEYARDVIVEQNADHAKRGSPQFWATAVLTYERTLRDARKDALLEAAQIADDAREDDGDARQIRDRINIRAGAL